MTIKCASEKWKEVFILNDLSFEEIPESCKSKKDIPIVIAKNVLKYQEQGRISQFKILEDIIINI